jgi:hypothetical protein
VSKSWMLLMAWTPAPIDALNPYSDVTPTMRRETSGRTDFLSFGDGTGYGCDRTRLRVKHLAECRTGDSRSNA